MAAAMELLAPRGSGAVRLALAGHRLDEDLAGELVAAGGRLGTSLVVRSSTTRESEPVWAGAFASYADIAPLELPKAVAGCWASMFTEDALARARTCGVAPGGVAMAVLVQLQIEPVHGGVARVADDGTVTIVGREGSPAPIVAGWEPGETVTVDTDGTIIDSSGPAALTPALVSAVAEVAQRTVRETGLDHIEWAEDDEEVWLLQARSAARSEAPAMVVNPPAVVDARLAAVVTIIAHHSGSLSESLVLPWAIGLTPLPAPVPPADDLDPPQLLASARLIARQLVDERWHNPAEAEAVLAGLRGADPQKAFDRLGELPAVDADLAALVLGLLERLAAVLAERGAIPKPAILAHLTLDEVESLSHRAEGILEPTRRMGRERWEPFLHSAVSVLGVTIGSTGVVPGGGAGRLRLIRSADDVALFRPREIVVADYPINNLAPLLWEAAAVVTVGGGRGAHLFEVAGSLGVAAVCGADVERVIDAPLAALTDSSFLGAVDGTTGALAAMRLEAS